MSNCVTVWPNAKKLSCSIICTLGGSFLLPEKRERWSWQWNCCKCQICFYWHSQVNVQHMLAILVQWEAHQNFAKTGLACRRAPTLCQQLSNQCEQLHWMTTGWEFLLLIQWWGVTLETPCPQARMTQCVTLFSHWSPIVFQQQIFYFFACDKTCWRLHTQCHWKTNFWTICY